MTPADVAEEVAAAVDGIGSGSFSTAEVMNALRGRNSATWQAIAAKYGEGGRGSGSPYSAAVFVAQQLDKAARRGTLVKLDYRPAPTGWGNAVIRYWALNREGLGGTLFPDEVPATDTFVEGVTSKVLVNRYERDPKASEACIEHFGVSCVACEMNFEDTYGAHGAGFIHIHHLWPLSEVKQAHTVDPTKDLVPVCPNCHAMIHYGPETLTIAAVRQLMKAARAKAKVAAG